MTPEDVRALKALIESQQTTTAPFDIALGGRRRDPDWEKERRHIRAVAEAGATWWVEYVPPDKPEAMHASILQGPLRID
jgi:hypothetical protein